MPKFFRENARKEKEIGKVEKIKENKVKVKLNIFFYWRLKFHFIYIKSST